MTTDELNEILRKESMYLRGGCIYANGHTELIGYYSATRIIGDSTSDTFVIAWVGHFSHYLSMEVKALFKTLALVHGFEVR